MIGDNAAAAEIWVMRGKLHSQAYCEESISIRAVQRDEAMRSCALAAQTLMLAAQSLGYDSCPMTGFDFGRVGELIRLPADHVLAMAVAIGRGVEPAPPRAGRLDLAEVAVTDRF